jgi:hypothetical protein
MKEYMKTIFSGLKILIKNSRSDWNQNDTSSENYIENRTHWSEEKAVEFLPETTLTLTAETDENMSSTVLFNKGIRLVNGDSYLVKYNGVDYNVVARDVRGVIGAPVPYIVLGNTNLFGMADTGEPFTYLMMYDDTFSQSVVADWNMSESCTITIIGSMEIVHKLDEKYLPSMISYGTEELESGVAKLPDGHIYLMLEEE